MSNLEKRVAEIEKRLDNIEPHVRRSMPLGPNKEYEKELEESRTQEFK